MKDLFGSEPIRYLGWKQPFAELMFYGKQETRTWYTDYRGLVMITASAQPYNPRQVLSISGIKQFYRIEETLRDRSSEMMKYMGCGIGIGRLVDCLPMRKEDEDICFVEYREGLWRHIYADVVRIKPIKYKGAQGWRKLTPEFINNIEILK